MQLPEQNTELMMPEQDTQQMITIADIPTGVSFGPAKSLRMLWGQPHLDLEGTGTAYRLTTPCAERQRRILTSVYEIVISSQRQFSVFPEYSMPLDMVSETEEAILGNEWPSNSIFVSGIAPISVNQFNELVAAPNNVGDRQEIQIGEAEFVNCCCVWFKNSEEKVHKVLQAKLRPSRPEQATQGMYKGNIIYLFQTDILVFSCLVCFDCIGINPDEFIAALTHDVVNGQTKRIDFLLVLQRNEHPEVREFTDFGERVLLPGTPRLSTGFAAAIGFVNSAHERHGRAPTERFGRTSLCYSRRGSWQPCGAGGPLNLIPSTFALENAGNTLVRVRFREDGPALHSFEYFIPSLIGPTAGDTKFPIEGARVHSILADATVQTGRVEPALRKVVADWLSVDVAAGDGRFTSTHREVHAAVQTSFAEVRALLDTCSNDRLEEIVTLLLGAYVTQDRPAAFNPDLWQAHPSNWVADTHGQAILELASVCTLLNVLSMLDFQNCDHSHTCKLETFLVSVLDGNNVQSCFRILEAYEGWLSRQSWGETIGKVNLLLITRPAAMAVGNRVEPVPSAYTEPSATEMAVLPRDIQPQSGSILTTAPALYWLPATVLRTALAYSTVTDMQQFLRRALEPEQSS
jgi:hypothetical protein